MKAKIIQMNQHQTMQQHMTSIEIADISGEQHQDVLERADDIIAEELEELNQQCKYCYTSTEIAKPYGLNANDLLSFLSDKGIVHKINGHYELTRKYRNEGFAKYRYSVRYNSRGKRKTRSTLVWTEEGRQFINEMIG